MNMKKIIIVFLLLTVVIGAIIGCHFIDRPKPPPPPPPPLVQREHAELILKNLAVGMRIYSASIGGGGERQFTGDISRIRRNVMQDAFAACSEKKPYHGFVIELTEFPAGDGFSTNFRFVAKPAPGYKGESFAVDKTEDVVLIEP